MKVVRPLLLALVVTLAVSACRRGDDDGGSSTPTPGTPAPTIVPSAAEQTVPPATASPGLPSPAGPGAYTTGEISGAITYGGAERTFRIYVPESASPNVSVPLIIGLHGGLGSGEQFAANTRFDGAAERGGFIAVYPDGIGRTWNAGRCCGVAARTDVDDVGFISALIDELAARYEIDLARVYATGHSNGAMMALRLACELPERIHAVVAVAGGLEAPACAPPAPRSVLLIHGDADQNHPLEGGQGPDSIAGVDFVSVADSMETLRLGMSCDAATEPSESGGITTTTWSGCPPGVELKLEVIAGGSHAWPGGTGGVLTGEASDLLDATSEAAGFLLAH